MSARSLPRHVSRFRRAFTLALATGCALPGLSPAATPVVALHWTDCAGPSNLDAGSTLTPTLVVSAQGLQGTVLATQFAIYMHASGGGLPDAWRFDTNGCPSVSWRAQLAGSGRSCPLLEGAGLPNQLSSFRYLSDGGSFMRGELRFAEAFNAPAVATAPDYVLAKIVFDLSAATLGGTSADSCGCLGRPICFAIFDASYLDSQGAEQPFDSRFSDVTWNDLSGYACSAECFPYDCVPDSSCLGAPTPARATSWGYVKGMYRAPAR
jgi:hypothetical protein